MPTTQELRDEHPTTDTMNHASRLRQWLPRLKWAWLIHFILTLLPVVYGIYVNGGTKYVHSEPSLMQAVRTLLIPVCLMHALSVLSLSFKENTTR